MSDRDDEATTLSSGADLWADQPSRPPAAAVVEQADEVALGVAKVTRHFDEFDPFKPGQASEAPLTPSKRAPPPPSKMTEAAMNASAMHNLAIRSGHSPITKSKPPVAAHMTPSISSGLANPLASIASVFKARPTASRHSTTPTNNNAARAVLIRDKDDNADIEESEKSAPPAIPSNQPVNANPENGDDDEDAPPFDFNLFLEQMRGRAADPIAKYLRSFLKEFGKRSWSVGDQIRVINDFLDFIAVKMRENETWKSNSEMEFDNAVEAMEKLVMNRVYHLTFIPALSPAQQSSTQTDDLERDHVFSQRIKLFGWVNEKHLDLPETSDSDSFVDFAKQELLKINTYKAPRDKLICILNCCKVIFGLMRHLEIDDGADTFIPFLILIVLRANPEHLISNVQYIQRFRNPERLAGENGYYLSSLNGAISFVETMDSSSLSGVNQEDFEAAVEKAIAALPPEEDHKEGQVIMSSNLEKQQLVPQASDSQRQGDVSLLQAPYYYGDSPIPRSASPAEVTKDFLVRSSDNLQRTVSKPLQALTRIFTEMGSDADVIAGVPRDGPTHQQAAVQTWPRRRASQSSIITPVSPHRRRGYDPAYLTDIPQVRGSQQQPPQQQLKGRRSIYQAADYLDDSVTAEEVQEEADRAHEATFSAKIDTLMSIFPDIEKETLEIVLLSNGEDVERTIEGLLEMA